MFKILLLSFLLILPDFKVIHVKQQYAENIKKEALRIAHTQLGVKEIWGNNKGPEINQYLIEAGYRPGDSWCMAFQQFIFRHAAAKFNVNLNLVKSGHCLTVFAWAGKNKYKKGSYITGKVYASPGDIMIMKNMENSIGGHTGIVDSIYNTGVFTIEGNTSPSKFNINDKSENNSKLDGVYYKQRSFLNYGHLKIIGFISLKD